VGQAIGFCGLKNNRRRVRAASTRTGAGGAFSTLVLFAPARNDFRENGSKVVSA
jgi:hypothetical protein